MGRKSTEAQRKALEAAKGGRVSGSRTEFRANTIEALERAGLVRANWPIGLEAMVHGRRHNWFQLTDAGRKAMEE